MTPAHILFLNPTAQLGGAEHSLLDLAAGLDRRDFSVRIGCLGVGPLVDAGASRGIPVETLSAPAAFVRASFRGGRSGPVRAAAALLGMLPTVGQVRRLLKAHGPAIVHSNGNKTHLISVVAGCSRGRRLVWHVRDFFRDGAYERWLVRQANRRVDAVIANSKAVAAHLKTLGVRPDLVHTIPNGIDCGRFSPSGPIAALKREFDWPEESRIIGMVGIFAPWKGQHIFLRAAGQILRRAPDVRCLLVGDEIYKTDGHVGYKEDLVRLARELGIHHAVAFAGYRDDIPEILRGLDVAVHASTEPEPFGRVVAEALACARPLVATEGGGVPEITGPSGETALLVPRGDPDRLAGAVLDLLAGHDRARRMAAAGRARIVDRFDIGHHVRMVEDLYRSLLGNRRLKVLHAGKFYPPSRGGVETVLEDLCTGTARDWRVDAVVSNHSPRTVRERRDGVGLVRAAALAMFGPVPVCPTLPFHLWRRRHDCVILHEPNALAALALLLWTRARHLVIWHHSDPLRPGWALHPYAVLQRFLYRRATCVIASSPRLAESSTVLRFAGTTAIIPYGIALERFAGTTDGQAARAEAIRAGYPGPRVLFVGRLVYYKGLDILLEAFTKCPGTLLVIGRGPLENTLKGMAAALHIRSRVAFLPEVPSDELVAYYHAADVFVLPSTERTEAFGIVQIEAMACGLPVVSTDLPTGVPWVNQDGITGLVVPPRDPDALAAAINRLLDDSALRERMGEEGRRRATEVFSRDRMVQDFRNLIEKIACQ